MVGRSFQNVPFSRTIMEGSKQCWDWSSKMSMFDSRKSLDLNSLFFLPKISPLHLERVLNQCGLGPLPPAFS